MTLQIVDLFLWL